MMAGKFLAQRSHREKIEGGLVRRLKVIVAAATVMSGLLFAPAVHGVGACIGPITKSAIYTYQDRFGYLNFGDPVKISKFKLTATFCYDSLGNAWGTAPITWKPISGAYFVGISNNPVYVRSDGFAYAKLSFGFYKINDGTLRLRIEPKLKISGVNGRFTAFDTGAVIINPVTGTTYREYDPVFVSAALQ